MIYKARRVSFLIDDDDYERVKKYEWYLSRGHNIQNKDGITIGRFILNYSGPLEVDHKDRNIKNNQKENLRLATRQQQLANRWPIGNNRYKGVSYDKNKRVYRAHICVNYRVKHIGCFKSERRAAIAYNKAAKEIWGEFAYLNVTD